MKKRKNLTLEVRQQIYVMRSQGLGIRETGRKLKINPSVICRELKRNALSKYAVVYSTALEKAKAAHEKARERQKAKRRGKRKARPAVTVYKHIAEKLAAKWSPEAIANKWGEKFNGSSISTSTVYRMIKHDWPELKQYLPEHGKKRRAKVMDRRGKVQKAAEEKRHISERPEEANLRQGVGHLEVDSILSKRGSKAAIVSIIDRKIRRRWYILVPNLEAETVRKALVRFLHTLPPWQRKTLTLDRGSEFAEWPMLEKIFPGLTVYFCTAYSPHEKGSVERSNRDFRRIFPKGTDFAKVSILEIQFAQDIINAKPMKCLGWKTPAQVQSDEEENFQKAA